VELSSTVQDLETGTLITHTPGEHKGVNMPTKILDPERFKAVLFEAWKQGVHAV
jgi:hypothetical protein